MILNRDGWPPLGTDQPSRRDLLLLLPVDTTQRVTDLHIQVTGESGLVASAEPAALAPAPEALETRTYLPDLGPAAADGHRVVKGWIARVPVTLTPTKPWDIGGDRYPLRVTATYYVPGTAGCAPSARAPQLRLKYPAPSTKWESLRRFCPLYVLARPSRRWRRTR